ncbi:MAG: hypothetical protein Q8868_02750 [Bacteroidota bacterium]|nr:hypothetical protein [Bacteroidota bacterium]
MDFVHDPMMQYIRELPDRIKNTGRSEADPLEISLMAGNLTMHLSNGSLRYISIGNNELIRRIYASVRDPEWLTITPAISEKKYNIRSDSFRLEFSCRYISAEIDFTARFEIEGRIDNSIIFSMDGIATRTFKKNRIGFCILHPIENTAGKVCFITHTNGIVENSLFPEFVQPHQPFLDIKSMKWQVAEGTCSLDFEGDVFETEDQRNWTDASFKTYCTPLSEPFPVIVHEGTSIKQRIVFRAENFPVQNQSEKKAARISLDPQISVKVPSIGIARATRAEPLSGAELRLLRPLRFDHYRIEVRLFENGWKEIAIKAVDEALKLAAKIEFVLFVDDNYEIQTKEFCDWLKSAQPGVLCLLLFHKSFPATPKEIAEKVIPVFKTLLPDIKTGTGTNANFVQLNRNRQPARLADFITFSIQPQEHASDNQTLIENLAAQEDVVRSAAEFADGSAIWISPVNIQRRFNANLSFIEEPFTGHEIPPQIDARIMSLLGAGWTAISLKYLCRNNIAGVTYYETAGERGIMQGEYSSRWPQEFPAYSGMIFPVYFIFRYLQANRSLKVIGSSSSQPLSADSLVLSDGKQVRMILVNFTKDRITAIITGCKGMMRLRELNSRNYSEAASNYKWRGETGEKMVRAGMPLIMEPFSICFIEGWLKK